MSDQRKTCGKNSVPNGSRRCSGELVGLLTALLMIFQGLIAIGGSIMGAAAGEGRSVLTASRLRANCGGETRSHEPPGRDVAHHGQCCIACDADESSESIMEGGLPAGVAEFADFGGSIRAEIRAPDIGERLIGWMTSWSSRAPPLSS